MDTPNNNQAADHFAQPAQPWADFGLIHQFGFPFPGGLYLSFLAVGPDSVHPITVEIPLTREVVGGGVFRPTNGNEKRMMKSAGWEVEPKWTWIIPRLRYRIFIPADLIKELLLMWSMGWEASEQVKAALAQTSQGGLDDLEREKRVKAVLGKMDEGWGGSGGGGGWKQ